MNRIFNFTVFTLLSFIAINAVGAEEDAFDYNKLNSDRKACYQVRTSDCFNKLMVKYKSAPANAKNYLRYDFACGLMMEENYSKAKENFKLVLTRESQDQNLIKNTKQRLNQISQIQKQMISANNMDAGNYYKSGEVKGVWADPAKIKVYIASNIGKEAIFKKAFLVWDNRMNSKIGFVYVKDASEADIVIKYVDSISGSGLSGKEAGLTTYTKVQNVAGKNYLKRVNVQICTKNPQGGQFTDTNLLSITIHEIGHALGITYHSDNKNDIMYYSTESYKNGSISNRDVNTLRQIYRH